MELFDHRRVQKLYLCISTLGTSASVSRFSKGHVSCVGLMPTPTLGENGIMFVRGYRLSVRLSSFIVLLLSNFRSFVVCLRGLSL